jgi:hypothetical protein
MTGDLTPVTTSSARLQHLASTDDLNREGWNGRGREGRALCDTQTGASVYDQEALQADRERWGYRASVKVIADLPLCKRCAYRAERRSA